MGENRPFEGAIRQGLDIAAQRARLKAAFSGEKNVAGGASRGHTAPVPSGRLRRALLHLVEIEGHEAALGSVREREGESGSASAQGMAAAFAAAGLVLHTRTKRLAAVTAADLPCVAETAEGGCLILLSMSGKDIRCAEGRTLLTLPVRRLKKMGIAKLYTCRPADGTEAGTGKGPWPGFYAATAQYLRSSERPLLVQLGIASVIGYVLMMALPLFTMAVYDRVIPHMALETLWALAIGVFLSLGLDLGVRHVRLKLSDAVALSTTGFLQGLLLRKILRTRSQAAPHLAAPVQQGLKEIENLGQLMPQAMVSIAVDAPFFFILLAFLAVLGGPVALAPLAGMAGIAALQFMQFRQAARSNGAVFQASQKQTALIGEVVEGLERVKALRAEGFVTRQWERLTDNYLMQVHANRVAGGLSAQGAVIVTQAVSALVLLIGVYQVRAGEMSMGALIASILLVGRTVAPMAGCLTSVMRLLHMKRTIGWLDGLMSAAEETSATERRRAPKPDYLLESVSLTYPGSHRPSLAGIKLRIEEGERVAVIGRSGSGKSSLLKLLCRIEEPSAGFIRLDGYNILQYGADDVRAMAGYAAQAPVLFDGTLWQNLTFGLEGVDKGAMEEACRIAGVSRFASEHPEGYGLEVGPRGERLSGGERQAVALARTLAVRPRLLLLDEPTAAFDTQGEEEFISSLGGALKGSTLVIATHRLPVLKLVERIILLENGQVLADGPKRDVIDRLSRKSA